MHRLKLTTTKPTRQRAQPTTFALYYTEKTQPKIGRWVERFGVYHDNLKAFGTRDYLVEQGFRALVVINGGKA